MIVLCASYISNMIKIKWMNEMIESWKFQSHHIPIYISISLDEKLKTIFNYYLENNWKIEDLNFIISEEKLSQFQHYKKLCDLLLDKYSRTTWIIFTDDDDIWDKDRILYYKTLVDNLKKLDKENFISHIQIPTHSVNYQDEFTKEYDIRNLNHIDMYNDSHQHLDYWQFSCQLKYLKDFIERCDPSLLLDGYCNLYFTKYFYNKQTPAYRWYTKDKNRFVYYWRGSAGNKSIGEIHLLEQLKKKSPEETLIKVYLQEGICSEKIKEKNKDHIKIYIDKNSPKLKKFNNKIMKRELHELFYGNKYKPYVYSPILEGVIE